MVSEVPDRRPLPRGEQVQVAYDPGDPAHVRLVDGWEPWHASSELGLALVVLGVGVVVSGGRLAVAALQVRREVSRGG